MPSELKRKNIVMEETEILSHIEDGMTLAIGGFIFSSHPQALIRQIIKSGVKDLTLMAPVSATLETDLLIGAGCVKKLITSYVGLEEHLPIGNMFRTYAQEGKIDVWECDESHWYSALKAGSHCLPFFPDRAGVGTDFPKVNPDLKLFEDPLNGEPLLAVPAIQPDVVLLYAAWSDPYGNAQVVGTGWGDRLLFKASKKVFVQVEKIVPNEVIRRNPEQTAFFSVDGIVVAPYGGHPFSGPGFYIQDDLHIQEYRDATIDFRSDPSKFQDYLEKYIYGPETHLDYLEQIGVKRLISLHEQHDLEPR